MISSSFSFSSVWMKLKNSLLKSFYSSSELHSLKTLAPYMYISLVFIKRDLLLSMTAERPALSFRIDFMIFMRSKSYSTLFFAWLNLYCDLESFGVHAKHSHSKQFILIWSYCLKLPSYLLFWPLLALIKYRCLMI